MTTMNYSLLFLVLGKSDDTAADWTTLTFSSSFFVLVSGGMFGLVEIILTFIHNKGATED